MSEPMARPAPAERWLVVAHEATNSGAPRMLLEVLRGVRAARGPGWSCEILLRRGGPLAAEFETLGRVHLLSHPWAQGPMLRAGIFRKFIDRPWVQPRRLAAAIAELRPARFDLVYNNTATNEYLVPAVRSLGGPVLTHVHESAQVLREFTTPAALAQTLDNTDHFLAVSPAVAADLAAAGVPAGRITLAPNFLPALPPEPDPSARLALRAALKLPPESFVVAGCGHIHGIKGTDLFVETAAALAGRLAQPVTFVWLGGETDAGFARDVKRLVHQRNLEGIVRFVGPVPDTRPWFAASDVVAVTSRVESFSLVALEAAGLGRPVTGFAGARGLTELLGGEPGLLVPDFDPAAMAGVLLKLAQDAPAAEKQGRRLRAKVAADFLAGPRITALLAVIDRLRQNHPARS